MTTQEWLEFHRSALDKMHEITKKKNSDYTNGEDPFSNFKIAELMGVSTTEGGFFIRIMDKLSRLRTFIKRGTLEVSDETVTDTLLDTANYCILLAGYIESKRNK